MLEAILEYIISSAVDLLLGGMWDKFKKKFSKEYDLLEAMEESFEKMCDECVLEYEGEPVKRILDKSNVDTIKNFSELELKKVLSQCSYPEVNADQMKIWECNFYKLISTDKKYDNLFKIITTNKIKNLTEIISKLKISIQDQKSSEIYSELNIIGGKIVVSNTFCGRRKELNLIKKTFDETNIVMLKGEGGIGKTSIARQYYYENKNYYKRGHIIDASEGIKKAIIKINFDKVKNIQSNEDDIYIKNKQILEKYDKNSLIIFDNCDVDITLNELADLKMDCNFIITTRIGNSYFKDCIEIKPLTNCQLIKLAEKIHPRITTDIEKYGNNSIKVLHEFFKYIRSNTLVAEVAFALMKEGNISIFDIKEKLLNDSNVSLPFKTGKSANEILFELYDFASVTEIQEKIMSVVCLISPNIGITREQLYEFLKLEDFNELNILLKKHFIREDEFVISMHPVFSDVFYKRQEIYRKRDLVLNIGNYVAEGLFKQYNVETATKRLNCLEYIMNYRKEIFTDDCEGRCVLANIIKEQGDCYSDIGYYIKSSECLMEALVLYNKRYYKKKIADIYNNLGIVYSELGKQQESDEATRLFKKALFYKFKALKLYKKVYRKDLNNMSIAKVYNSIGATYDDLAKLAISNRNKIELLNYAIEYKYKSLEIRKLIFSKSGKNENSSIANCYNSLGVTYRVMGEIDNNYYEKSIWYLENAIKIYEKEIDNKDVLQFLALAYNNAGKAYLDIGNYGASQEYYEKALNLYETIYLNYPNHSDLRRIYKNLISLYDKLEDKRADIYRQKLLNMN